MKIWQRHILSRLAKTFLFFLASLFIVYVIIDLSAHGIRFLSKSTFSNVILYYLNTFTALFELFLTLAFLLASLRVLFELNLHRELLALQMAGLSKKKLLAPFFLFAALLSSACYINSQWFSPDSQDLADAFKTSHKTKKKKAERPHVYSVLLEDDSELVYQSFEKEKNELFDVFWIRSPHDIWHMKYLQIDPLRGRYVNHLIRNSAKQFAKSESFAAKDFPELPWNEEIVLHRFIPFASRPLFTLFLQACADSAERSSIFSHFYYKLLVPLMPFLVLFAIGPIAMRFSRNHPLFLIVATSIFGFISLKVILDGMLILGENQVLPATLAILGPIALTLAFSLPPFARLK